VSSGKIILMPDEISENINFVPEDADFKASLPQQLFRLMLTKGKTLIILTEIVVLVVFFSRFKLETDISDLSEEIKNKSVLVESAIPLQREYAVLQEQTETLENIYSQQTDWSKVIKSFDEQLPYGVIMNSVSYSGKEVNMSGTVDTAASFGKLIQVLNKNNNVEEVILGGSSYDTETKTYDFDLNLKVKELKNEF
jgi:Tfp pilus assembly protein PilN